MVLPRAPSQAPPASRYNDIAFLALFLAAVGAFVPFAWYSNFFGSVPQVFQFLGVPDVVQSATLLHPVWVCVFVVAPAVTLAAVGLWMWLLHHYAEPLLKWSLLGVVAFNAAAGVALLVVWASFGGVGCLLAAVVAYWCVCAPRFLQYPPVWRCTERSASPATHRRYYTWVRNRIGFAAVSLRVANRALHRAPNVLPFVLGCALAQLLWAVFSAAAVAGVAMYLLDRRSAASAAGSVALENNGGGTVGSAAPTTGGVFGDPNAFTAVLNTTLFGCAVVVLWGGAVLRAVAQCVVAAVVGDWWFRPQRVRCPPPSLL